MKNIASWLAMAVLSFGLTAASGVAGAIECGEVLTQDTLLEADLLNCPGDGLIVGANGISIDLGGHLIQAVRTLTFSDSAGIRNEGYHDVEIRNGTLNRFGRAVFLSGSTGNRIEEVTVGCAGYKTLGIELESSHENYLRGNRIRSCHNNIRLNSSNENTIEANQVWGSEQGAGVFLSRSAYNEILNNRVGGSEGSGIGLSLSHHNLLTGNVVSDNDGHGIEVSQSSHNRVISNTIATSHINVNVQWSNKNLVAGNEVLDGRVGIGLQLGSSNRIKGNAVHGHSGGGILVVGDERSRITGNTVVGNGSVGIQVSVGTDNTINGNIVADADRDGIEVEGTSPRVRLINNDVRSAGDDGIQVDDSTALIIGNSVLGNGDYGIEAVPGVRGGGNQASGNGNPDQCLNIACN